MPAHACQSVLVEAAGLERCARFRGGTRWGLLMCRAVLGPQRGSLGPEACAAQREGRRVPPGQCRWGRGNTGPSEPSSSARAPEAESRVLGNPAPSAAPHHVSDPCPPAATPACLGPACPCRQCPEGLHPLASTNLWLSFKVQAAARRTGGRRRRGLCRPSPRCAARTHGFRLLQQRLAGPYGQLKCAPSKLKCAPSKLASNLRQYALISSLAVCVLHNC